MVAPPRWLRGVESSAAVCWDSMMERISLRAPRGRRI